VPSEVEELGLSQVVHAVVHGMQGQRTTPDTTFIGNKGRE
jgi:hypothetical protein